MKAASEAQAEAVDGGTANPEGSARGGWRRARVWVPRVLRVGLGCLFIYMGLVKAMDPVGFLKAIRQYGVVDGPPWLNLLAACLPWFETFCGALWVSGRAVRGTAVILVTMLISFTALVWRHALVLQATTGVPFCGIRFDCGCGSGEVWVCGKLVENALLVLGAVIVLVCRPVPKRGASPPT